MYYYDFKTCMYSHCAYYFSGIVKFSKNTYGEYVRVLSSIVFQNMVKPDNHCIVDPLFSMKKAMYKSMYHE